MSDVWLSEEGALSKHFDRAATERVQREPVAEREFGSDSRLCFSGVRTLRANEECATSAIPSDIDLEFDMDDESGLLLRAGTEMVWSAQWSELVKCSTPERLNLSGGGRGVLLVVTALGQPPLLAVLPTDHPGKAEKAIRACASEHGVRGRRSSPAWWVVAAAVVAVAAAVTAFLVAAGHAFHL